MKTIAPADLYPYLTGTPDTVLLDVRTPVEFAQLRVPQARNVPLDKLDPASLLASGEVKKEKPVYLICLSGQRAAKAAEKFEAAGFADVSVVIGGTQAWDAANLPVVRSEGGVISLERQVRIAAGSIVLTGVLLAIFVYPEFIWLSGFVGAGLIFSGITGFCGMGLLIARLPWNNRVAPKP